MRRREITWTNPRVLSTLALVFLCGSVLGAAAARSYIHSRWASQTPATPAIEKARHVGLAALKTNLNLTPAQEQVVTKVLDDYGKFYQNIEDERLDVAEDGRRQILKVLTPEQRARFDELTSLRKR
jgi:Spy/CpxP family protein refolding chaperone